MQKAMETCQGDQQCLMQAGTRFALLMQQGKMDKPAAPPMADNDRLHHWAVDRRAARARSEEHTSELQLLMRISFAVFCLNIKHPVAESLRTHPTDQLSFEPLIHLP